MNPGVVFRRIGGRLVPMAIKEMGMIPHAFSGGTIRKIAGRSAEQVAHTVKVRAEAQRHAAAAAKYLGRAKFAAKWGFSNQAFKATASGMRAEAAAARAVKEGLKSAKNGQRLARVAHAQAARRSAGFRGLRNLILSGGAIGAGIAGAETYPKPDSPDDQK